MSRSGHDGCRPCPRLEGRAFDYPAGHRVEPHTHRRDQLVYAASGVLRVTTPSSVWVVPPQRALWVPAGVVHRHDVSAACSMRTLYFPTADPRLRMGEGPQLLEVSALARHVVIQLAEHGSDAEVEDDYVAVLRDQLAVAAPLSLELPIPDDPLAGAVARALLAEPSDPGSLQSWGRLVGASARTLSRRFRQSTGLTFDQWRRRARALRALELLPEGHTVESVAHAVGYSTPSAFIHAFRTLVGTTPAAAFTTMASSAAGRSRSQLPRDQVGAEDGG